MSRRLLHTRMIQEAKQKTIKTDKTQCESQGIQDVPFTFVLENLDIVALFDVKHL